MREDKRQQEGGTHGELLILYARHALNRGAFITLGLNVRKATNGAKETSDSQKIGELFLFGASARG